MLFRTSSWLVRSIPTDALMLGSVVDGTFALLQGWRSRAASVPELRNTSVTPVAAERIERGARLNLWTALDALGHRPNSGRWLDELAATPVPIELLFTAGDDGLKFAAG
jgi:hypothetical protein